MDSTLAALILALHLSIIVFNVAFLFIIPIGAWMGWRLVRIAWLRLLHLALMAIVAGQAVAGRACILTIWQARLTGRTSAPPMIMQAVDRLIYYDWPIWVFTIIYVTVFLYIVALSVLVPFGKGARHSISSASKQGRRCAQGRTRHRPF